MHGIQYIQKIEKNLLLFLFDLLNIIMVTDTSTQCVNCCENWSAVHRKLLNPFKPKFNIVIFIHYKPRIAVAILDL